MKVYTREGVLLHTAFSRNCLNKECTLTYTGQEHGIFFNVGSTGIANEVLWDFVALVKRGRFSFTQFCSDMTRRYTTTHLLAAPFMSRKAFVRAFFGWVASFDLDYRDHIDPWCQHNPKVLAGDGTHIGVAVRLMKMSKPISQAEKKETVHPRHKRFQRVLFPVPMEREKDETVASFNLRKERTQRARSYLNNWSKCVLGKGVPINGFEEDAERGNFDRLVRGVGEPAYVNFYNSLLSRTLPADVTIAASKFLVMLTSDASMSTLLPFSHHKHLLDTCELLLSEGGGSAKKLREMESYSREISNLFRAAQTHQQVPLVVNYIKVLVEQVKDVHSGDSSDEATPFPRSYNPTSGICYYFTEHGNQVRETPEYEISGKGKVCDDRPEVDELCQKLFPQVSYGGFGYMFLFFCPIHGHCYGFHLIGGGEGRKDPFSAMFKYMEEPPTDVFYDFACQLSEYCLNREPGFFKKTRFWHDIFHGITHVCGDCHKSTRITGMEAVNSEICEQFNSYLQCVKYTGSHLTQNHFMLLTQFFIYLYNNDKTEKFQKVAKVLISGCL